MVSPTEGAAPWRTPQPATPTPPAAARARWIDLCGPWGFAYDDDDVGLDEGWFERPELFDRTIMVPFPPESRASGIGDPGFHPVVWYRRTFDRAGRRRGRAGAAPLRRGRLPGRRSGSTAGWSPRTRVATRRSPPISPRRCAEAGDQVIVVRAEDEPLDLAQPRGKQDWESGRTRSGTTARPASGSRSGWSRCPATTSSELRWTPDLDRGVLGVSRVRGSAGAGLPRSRCG